MGKFEVKTDKAGKFRFNLKAGNGQVILASQGYASKDACMNGIESVKKNSQSESSFDMQTAKNGQFYFNLKASNGQVIGASEMYTTEAARKNGMESIMKNAPDATIQEA